VTDLIGETGKRVRLAWVDQLRGLAIVLMILDHVLVQVAPSHPLRYTATRLALPLFMACSAQVVRGFTRRRWAQLLAAIAAEAVLMPLTGLASPGILAVYLLATVLLMYTPGGHVAVVGVLGLLQAIYLSTGWEGYQPGLVVAYLAFGAFAALTGELQRLGSWLPVWLGSLGRRPLVWYIGHLLPLALWRVLL